MQLTLAVEYKIISRKNFVITDFFTLEVLLLLHLSKIKILIIKEITQ